MGATFIIAEWIIALLPINLWPPCHQRQMSVVVKVLCVNGPLKGDGSPHNHKTMQSSRTGVSMEILQSCYNRHGLQNKNWILAGLRNIKTSNFCCFDCAATTIVQTMSEHRFPLQLQHCPALHWYCSYRHNPPVIIIDCVRTLWIVWDCKTLRNCDCGGLAQDLVDFNRISMDYRPTIDSAMQKIASQSTKSGRNHNWGIIWKRADCGVSGGEKLVIFSMFSTSMT